MHGHSRHHHHVHGRGGYNPSPGPPSKKPHKIIGYALLLLGGSILFRTIIWRPMIEHPNGWGVILAGSLGLFIGTVYGYIRSESKYQRDRNTD